MSLSGEQGKPAAASDADLRAQLAALRRRSRRREKRLSHLANHDPLTGLFNRRGLAGELAAESRRRERASSALAAVLIDCDDFKLVNERLGRSGADHALRELARCLDGALRPTDSVGRIGGDEFLVLLPQTRVGEARAVADRLRRAVARLNTSFAGVAQPLTVSLGVAPVLEDSPSLQDLIALTELALARSKNAGKNRATVGAVQRPSGAAALLQEFRSGALISLREAPIVRLRDGCTVGWRVEPAGPCHGFPSPRDALRGSEDTEVLVSLDLECVRASLHRASARAATAELHVECLPLTLLERGAEMLLREVWRSGRAHDVCLELSEQQLVGDPAALTPALCALRAAGIRIALSEVSFGRSSLEALIVLEPNVVKLDAGFVRGVSADSGRERALGRLARLVAAIGCELHAAGVDTRADFELLNSLGVACGEGALLGAEDRVPSFPESDGECRRSGVARGGTTTGSNA